MSKKERINIRNLKVIRGYNLVSLRNNQRLLMKDSKIYNISPYSDCYDIFEIGNRLCAIVPSYTENHKENLIDLNTMEVLLTADSIKVIDDKTVIVIDNL